MAKRKVEVELILDAHNYLDETAKAAAATKALEAETEHLGTASDHAGTDLGEMAKNTDRASTSTAGLGRNMRDTGEALRLLDVRIAQTKLSVRDLGVEFATTGDAATGKQLDSERSLLGKLTSLRKEVSTAHEELKKLASLDAPFHLGDMGGGKSGISKWIDDAKNAVGDAAAAGVKIGSSIVSGIGTGFSELGAVAMPILISSLVGAALMAAPMVGGIIGGAVAAGVGTLGVAAGIFAATHDARVQAGLSALGDRVKSEFFRAGEAFAEPVLRSLGILSRALDDINFGATLGKAAPYVEIIVTGLANLLRNIMPGLNSTMDRLGPFARVAAEGFGALGKTFGGFIDDLTRSPGAIEGLKSGLMLISGTVRLLGKGIFYLAEAYDWVLAKAQVAAHGVAAFADAIPGMPTGYAEYARHLETLIGTVRNVPPVADAANGALGALTGGTTSFGEATWYAAMKVGDLSAAWDALHGRFATADQTLLRAKQAVDEVGKAFAENGRKIEGNSENALKNRVALENAAQVAAVAAEAYLKLTGDVAGAQKIMDDQRVAAEQATGATGNNAKAVHELAVKLFELPPFVETTVKVNITRYVWTKYVTTGNAPQINANLNLEDRLLGGRATGGPVGPGLWKVGERGPEYLEMGPGQNGYVHPNEPWSAGSNPPAGGWASGAGGGYATPAVNLTVNMIDPITGAVTRSMLITDALNRNQSSSVVAAAYP